jgi:hypothetical protein
MRIISQDGCGTPEVLFNWRRGQVPVYPEAASLYLPGVGRKSGNVDVMNEPPSAPEWFLKREPQVMSLFRGQQRKQQFTAFSRCPTDGGLLGATCQPPDGLWVWIAGGRMSPAASLEDFRSEYLDVYDEEEWTDDTFEQAWEYANEQVSEWGGRKQWDPVVLKVVLPDSLDESFLTWDRHSPEPRRGAETHRTVTCGRCRTHYLLPVLALIAAGIRVWIGLARPGTWVRPLTYRPYDLLLPPRDPGEDIYSVSAGGHLVMDLRERQ